ncbi:hypothetical protein ACFLQ8_02660 [Candidatus Auribacterota bacterium]
MRKRSQKKTVKPVAQVISKAADPVRRNFLAELRHFRDVTHQCLVSFQLKTEGEIAQTIEAFSNKRLGVSDDDIIVHKKTIDEMRIALKRLKIKANKGRKKDIKRIEELVGKLRSKTNLIT